MISNGSDTERPSCVLPHLYIGGALAARLKIITDGVRNLLSVAKCRVSSTSVFLLSFFSAVQTSSWVSLSFFCTKFNSKAFLQVMAVFSCSVWNNYRIVGSDYAYISWC